MNFPGSHISDSRFNDFTIPFFHMFQKSYTFSLLLKINTVFNVLCYVNNDRDYLILKNTLFPIKFLQLQSSITINYKTICFHYKELKGVTFQRNLLRANCRVILINCQYSILLDSNIDQLSQYLANVSQCTLLNIDAKFCLCMYICMHVNMCLCIFEA